MHDASWATLTALDEDLDRFDEELGLPDECTKDVHIIQLAYDSFDIKMMDKLTMLGRVHKLTFIGFWDGNEDTSPLMFAAFNGEMAAATRHPSNATYPVVAMSSTGALNENDLKAGRDYWRIFKAARTALNIL